MTPIHDRDGITLYQGDCLAVLPTIESESVALVVADLPYKTTQLAFDKQAAIDLDVWWSEIKRVLKPKGAALCFGVQPFVTELIMSNRKWFRYELIWEKTVATRFLDANRRPLLTHENIAVFAEGQTAYNPQLEKGEEWKKKNVSDVRAKHYGAVKNNHEKGRETRHPRSVLRFPNPNNDSLHPTQKPLALIEWLILTYSNPDDLILDPTCGSGTTLRAAANTGRRAIGIEQDAGYCQTTIDRMAQGVLLTV